MRAARFSVPATFRNPNFLKAGIGWSVATLVALAVFVASGFPTGLTAITTVVVLCALSAYYVMSWFRRTLRVVPDGIVIGHWWSREDVPWARVGHFAIREPSRRTPFMLAFHWWADQAQITLTDGSVRRIAGVEPRHGTIGGYFRSMRRSAADEAVDWLNGLARRSTTSEAP